MPLRTFRDEMEAHLQSPTKENLRRRLGWMRSGHKGDGGILQPLRLAEEDRPICLDQDVVLQAILEDWSSLLVDKRMHLDLVDHRQLPPVIRQRLDVLHIVVRDPNRFDKTSPPQLEQGIPGLHELAGVGRMDQIQIDVAHAELLQALLTSRDGLLEPVVRVPEFRAHPQLLPGDARVADRLSDAALVPIDHGRVDHPVAQLQSPLHSVVRFRPRFRDVDPKSKHRHLTTITQLKRRSW
mmetsp:Transcript_105686/g.268527  ORF Transcript_105686/g.268527 Transcript_105686/m.268527 type:complete len:239 (-) Transcript_105686:191-907(-)